MEPQGTVTRKAKTEKVVRGMPGTNYIEILSGARLLHLENEKTYFFSLLHLFLSATRYPLGAFILLELWTSNYFYRINRISWAVSGTIDLISRKSMFLILKCNLQTKL